MLNLKNKIKAQIAKIKTSGSIESTQGFSDKNDQNEIEEFEIDHFGENEYNMKRKSICHNNKMGEFQLMRSSFTIVI